MYSVNNIFLSPVRVTRAGLFVVKAAGVWYNGRMIKLTPLFSGSKGNSTLITSGGARVLLDAGYGFKATVAKLGELGVRPQDVSAIVVTHEHGDHVAALPIWTRHFRTPVYVPAASAQCLRTKCCCADIREVTQDFELCDMHVDVFCCSHDARACLGYRFSDKNQSVASVTDTGVATMRLVHFLQPCTSIMLESNHDGEMLQKGNYPYLLKKRIASDTGHLSNEQAAKILQRLLGSSVRNVVLAHLSQQNNTPRLAYDCAAQMYEQNGVQVGKDVYLYVADQFRNEVTI